MKTGIHPEMYNVVFVDTSTGAQFITTSTTKGKETLKINGKDYFVIKVELSSDSHPFYTGKQKLIDTAGRVDKFMAKMKKAEEVAAKIAEAAKGDDDDEDEVEVAETVEETEVKVAVEAEAKEVEVKESEAKVVETDEAEAKEAEAEVTEIEEAKTEEAEDDQAPATIEEAIEKAEASETEK